MGSGYHGGFGSTTGAQTPNPVKNVKFTPVNFEGSVKVNGVERDVSRKVYQRDDINFNRIDKDTGETNLQRMLNGLAPLDPTGIPYELHHIGQEANATLAMLTHSEHANTVLHMFKEVSVINRKLFDKQRARFYKEFAKLLMQGV